MSVWALGINHQTAPLDLRGRFAIAMEQLQPALMALRRSMATQPEATILSTCNRTEVYGAGGHGQVDDALQWLAGNASVGTDDLRSHAYVLHDEQAARHAFRVASGLDSMVLGEPQILGQFKQAVRAAHEAGAIGTTLHQLFQRSFAVAKEVRSSTDIGAHSISMAAAAVRLAAQIFEDMAQTRVAYVGAGEMIELAAAHFCARHPRSVHVVNRTRERGEALASRIGAQWLPLADLPGHLHDFDIVVSSTASTLPIIGLGAVERALKKRRGRPVFMVDLAVPRDIEPEVKGLSSVFLYTVDDLATVVQTGQSHRQAAVAQAEAIIDTGVRNFMHWMGERDATTGVVPLIQQLQARSEVWRSAEVNRARKALVKGDDPEQVIEALSRSLAQKMLHGAMVELRNAEPTRREAASAAIRRFFLSH